MNLLAVESSTEACSCALLRGGQDRVEERLELAPRRHTQLLLPMIQALLDEHGLTPGAVDRFAYGCGPGSFTGVRIAASIVQGLALAAGRAVVPVSSLAALAARVGAPGEHVLAVLDARMGEVYVAGYRIDQQGLPRPLGTERLGAPDVVELPRGDRWTGVGPGWSAYRRVLEERLRGRLAGVREGVLPGAAQVARLAALQPGLDPARALPGYLRREVTTPRRGASSARDEE